MQALVDRRHGKYLEYVGRIMLGDRVSFMRLTVTRTDEVVLDLPDQFRFNLLAQEVHISSSRLRFRTDSLAFEGLISGERLSGTISEGAESGAFDAYAVQPISSGDYALLLAHYALPQRGKIAFSRDIRPDEDLYFYNEADQVVRVYPVGASRFVSERCETISLNRDAGGRVKSLLWQVAGRADSVASRLAWSREEEIRISVDDYVIAGTLLLPLRQGPHPAIILCHHASVPYRDYYRLFAEPFVEQGIAAFIYDKRGWGNSTGAQLTSEISELATDAVAAFRFIQAHSAIQADSVGIWGISNGAWVGPLAASQVDRAAFVIGASLAGVTPARQEQIRRANVARELGASPRAVALINRLWELLFKFMADGEWNADLELILEEVNNDDELQALPKYPGHAPELQPVPARQPIERIRAGWGGHRKEVAFDPAPIFAGLRCPILCIWGEQDAVLPLQESVERIKGALLNSNHATFDLHVLPDATHMLYLDSPEPEGMLTEVMHTYLHNVSLSPKVRQLMVDWSIQALGG